MHLVQMFTFRVGPIDLQLAPVSGCDQELWHGHHPVNLPAKNVTRVERAAQRFG